MLGRAKFFRDDLGHEPALVPPDRGIPLCPVCGGETWELVRDFWGDTVGCPGCVDVTDIADDADRAARQERGGCR